MDTLAWTRARTWGLKRLEKKTESSKREQNEKSESDKQNQIEKADQIATLKNTTNSLYSP